MSDDLTPNVTSGSVNNVVDQTIRPTVPIEEKYSTGDEGNKIAIDAAPPAGQNDVPTKSWTLSELERSIAQDTLTGGRQKVNQFGNSFQRRNDFRLREMTRRIDRQTRQEFGHQVKTKRGSPTDGGLTDFTVRKYAYQQISTNATLATYQFQRSTVLPFMRKSLALDFQKTHLLKQVVGALGSLEKATISKLEAIKMNTGASAPTKVSLFTRVRNSIRDKQIDRVATNISNKIMEGQAKAWKKSVAPIISELNGYLKTEGPEGGANLASRKMTTKLNKIRRQLHGESKAEPDPTVPFAGIKRTASGFGARALDKVVGFGQRFKLPGGFNTLATKPLAYAADLMDGVNPFSGGEIDKNDIDDLEAGLKNGGGNNQIASPQFTSIAKLLAEWKDQSAEAQIRLLDHVSDIRNQLVTPQLRGPTSVPKVAKTAEPVVVKPRAVKKVTTRRRMRSQSPIKPIVTATPDVTVTPSLPKVVRAATPAGPSTKMVRVGMGGGLLSRLASSRSMIRAGKKILGIKSGPKVAKPGKASFFGTMGKRLLSKETTGTKDASAPRKNTWGSDLLKKVAGGGLATASRLSQPATPSAASVLPTVGAPIAPKLNPWATPAKAAETAINTDINKSTSVLSSVMGGLGEQLAKINETLQSGNDARMSFEENQAKRQAIADAEAAKSKVRKGSYEDLMQQRELAKTLSPVEGPSTAEKTRASTAAGILAAITGANDEEEAPASDDPSLLDQATDLLGDSDGGDEKAGESDGKKPKKEYKRKGPRHKFREGRPGARARLKRMRGARSGKGFSGFLKKAGRGAAKGTMGLGKGLFKGGLGAAKLGGKGLAGAAKMGGKGLWGFAKSGIGKASIGAVAAGVAGNMLENSDAPDIVKKAGGTAASMASWGSTGAAVGAMFGGVGAVPGAAIGAALGAVIANADAVSSAFGSIAQGAKGVTKGIWSTIFGQNAKMDRNGNIVQQEKTSILGDLRTMFFGREAKFTADGQTIMSARGNLFSNIQYGFEKTLFGDRFSNGEFKEGTSLLDMARDGLKGAIENFTKQVTDLPTDMKEGFKKGAIYQGGKWAKDKLVQGGRAVADGAKGVNDGARSFFNKPANPNAQAPAAIAALMAARTAVSNFSWKGIKDSVSTTVSKMDAKTIFKLASMATPSGFISGATNAITGWWMDSEQYNDPAKPQYKFVDYVLNAYGIKSRSMYKFIHTLQISQEKINNNQAKAFTDGDLAYMSTRFGFDAKNQDGVNYFKMWYTKRFVPAMAVIDKVLKIHSLTFAGVLAATDKQLLAVNDVLVKEIANSGVLRLGMEPTVTDYNRYAKIGTTDPGSTMPGAMNKDKPFDPRDPNAYQNQQNNSGGGNQNNPNSPGGNGGSGNTNSGDYGGGGNESGAVAGRKKAKMTKGSVTQQPEFRDAFRRLPPEIKKVVTSSRALQFVLWSSAVQHGPEGAALIFERDYTTELDESGYLRSIYQDRAQQFNKLAGNDRVAALTHLKDEQNFTKGVQNGTSNMSRGNLEGIVSNVYDPSGNYSAQPMPIPKGTSKQRTQEAMQYLMQKGYTTNAAAGIVGNLIVESGLRTNAVGDGGKAWGLAQWHPNRRAGISKGLGRPFQSLDFKGQLDAVDWELTTGNEVTGGKSFKNKLQNAQSPSAAAVMFMQKYERPADDSPTGKNARERGGYAMTAAGSAPRGPVPAMGAPIPGGNPKPTPAQSTSGPGKPQPQKPSAPTPAPRPTKKPAPRTAESLTPAENKAWMAGLNAHTKATQELTSVMRQQNAPMKPSNNTMVSPLIVANRGGGNGDNFAAASMKKFSVVTGK